MKYLKSLTLILLIASMTACGGTTIAEDPEVTYPSILSFVDANGTDLLTTNAGINPTELTITFADDVDMDSSTVTEDNITLECVIPDGNDLSQPTYEIAGSGNEYTLSIPVNAWKYALLDCTVTFSPDISSTSISTGKATGLPEELSYTFTNGCALSDDFNADSKSCWNNVDMSDIASVLVTTVWSDIDSLFGSGGFFSLDVSYGIIDVSSATAATAFSVGAISKDILLDSNVFSIVTHFSNVAGCSDYSNGCNSYVVLTNDINDTYNASPLPGTTKPTHIAVGIQGIYCVVQYMTTGVNSLAIKDCSTLNDDVYVRADIESGVVSFSYSEDGVTYFELDELVAGEGGTVPFPATVDFASAGIVYLQYQAVNMKAQTMIIFEDFEVTGVTSETQY